MADPLRKDRLEVGAERRVRIPAREVRLRRVRDRRARVPEHRRPLLDLLEEVLREERRVAIIRATIVSSQPVFRPQIIKGKGAYAVPCQTCIFGRAPV